MIAAVMIFGMAVGERSTRFTWIISIHTYIAHYSNAKIALTVQSDDAPSASGLLKHPFEAGCSKNSNKLTLKLFSCDTIAE